MIGELTESELEQLEAHALEASPGVCAVEARELLELISGYRRGKVPRFNLLRRWGTTIAGFPSTETAFEMVDYATRERWSGTIEEALAKQETLATSGVCAFVVLVVQKGSSRS
jgi:hypothetical protein